MPTVAQYSSIIPTTSSPAATLPSLPVNFSGVPASDGTPSLFTVAGWVRAPQPTQPVQVFVATGQFQVWFDTSGDLCAAFGSTETIPTAQVSSCCQVADGTWHFIAVSYQQIVIPTTPTPTETNGLLRLYVDGSLLDAANVAPPTPTSATVTPTLGASGSSEPEFASWLVWSVAASEDVLDVPDWGEPIAGSESARGLVAAFDFAQGGVTDQSGHHYGSAVSPGAQQWNTPCLQLPAGSYATVQQPTPQINPGGAGPFSVVGWVASPAPSSESVLLENWFSDRDDLSVSLQADSGNISATFVAPGYGQPPVPVYEPGPWVHLALTYNGYFFQFYINGALAASGSPDAPLPISPSTSPGLTLGSSTVSGATANLQNVSIGSVALSGDQISREMTNLDPSSEPGCVAHFPLMLPGQTPCDTVNGLQLTLPAGSVVLEIATPITAPATTGVQRASAGPRSSVAGDVALMRHKDYLALARQHGIDLDAAPDVATLTDPDFKAGVAWYEELLRDVHPRLASRLRERFFRNLYTSMQLAEKAPQAGRFSIATVDGLPTVMYGTAAGQRPLPPLSDELLSSTAAVADNYVAILFDVVGIVTAVLGVITTAAKLESVVRLYRAFLQSLAVSAARNITQTASTVEKAAEAILGYLGALQGRGLLSRLLKGLIVGSWWSLIFTVVQIVLQIAAMILSGGALLAMKIAQMVLAVGRLVVDVLKVATAEAIA